MSFLVANLPVTPVWVKKEYLYDLEEENGKLKGEGDLVEGTWVTVKSKPGRALLFETLLLEYGALYDKLPISAFVWKEDYDKDNQLPLEMLELWDAFSYWISVIQKDSLVGLPCKNQSKDKKFYKGNYYLTIDSCHPEPNILNTGYSELQQEHKSFNIIKLDNGQFAAQPNNRIRWYEQSLIPEETEVPDFNVCTKDYSVETGDKWSLGDNTQYFYKTKDEQEENE